jgi:hypothetical protein
MYPADTENTRKARNKGDGVVRNEKGVFLFGLGPLEWIDKPIWQRSKIPVAWQWARLSFGQTVLIKHGEVIPEGKVPTGYYTELKNGIGTSYATANQTPNLDPDIAFQEVLKAEFDPAVIGRMLLLLADQDVRGGLSVEFAARIAKARNVQRKKQKNFVKQ